MAAAGGVAGGVFLDNAPKHIAELNALRIPTLETIQIPQTGDDIAEMAFGAGTALNTMISSLGPNLYLDALKILNIPGDHYDPLSGITGGHLDTIFTVVGPAGRGYSKQYVLFDWDRTLTKFEGLFPESKIFEHLRYYKPAGADVILADPVKYRQDMLFYLFGGNEQISFRRHSGSRLSKIRECIDELIRSGVTVHILTNNGGCGFPDFTNLVAALDSRITSIICSGPHKGNKGDAFTAARVGSFSGGRRSRRRRNQRRRSTSRRQNRRL